MVYKYSPEKKMETEKQLKNSFFYFFWKNRTSRLSNQDNLEVLFEYCKNTQTIYILSSNNPFPINKCCWKILTLNFNSLILVMLFLICINVAFEWFNKNENLNSIHILSAPKTMNLIPLNELLLQYLK